MKGKLIVIEGLDGSGKSTQFEKLVTALGDKKTHVKGISFPDYNEPSSTLVKMYLSGEFGKSVDSVNTYAASSFYSVDRYASYKLHWQSEFENGVNIVAARYVTSNMIHQMCKLDRSEWDEYLAWLDDYEYGRLQLPRPDCVIFLDVPVDVSQQLLLNRYSGDENRRDIHESSVAYLHSCHDAAVYAAEKYGWRVISCTESGSMRTIEDIHRDIMDIINTIPGLF